MHTKEEISSEMIASWMSRLRVVAFILAWLICGLYSYGTMMAHEDYGNHNRFASLHLTSRDDLGFCVGVSLFGPVSVMAAATTSNFNQHGWELWEAK